jgi:hypothetical protein
MIQKSAAAPVVKALPAVVAKQVAPTQPVAKKPATPKPAPQANQSSTSWSESIRKAMQDKSNQSHGPDRGHDWKNQPRAGLSINHRNKFG